MMKNVVVFLLPLSEIVAFIYALLWVSLECIPSIYFTCSHSVSLSLVLEIRSTDCGDVGIVRYLFRASFLYTL